MKKILSNSLAFCFLVFTACSHDNKFNEKPYDLQALKQNLEKDADYTKFVELTKEIKLMIVENRVNVEEIVEKMKAENITDGCLIDLKIFENMRGGVEYLNKSCELSKVRARLFKNHKYLKDLPSEDRKYLIYSDTRISVDPNELIIKRK